MKKLNLKFSTIVSLIAIISLAMLILFAILVMFNLAAIIQGIQPVIEPIKFTFTIGFIGIIILLCIYFILLAKGKSLEGITRWILSNCIRLGRKHFKTNND